MPIFLHAGCGRNFKSQTTKGFNTADWQEVRLDIDPAVQPDHLGSMTNMQSLPSASVDAVYSSHNIEHLFAHEVPLALQEFSRVLKDDGFAVITCPDLQSVCQLVAEDRLLDPAYQSPAGPISPLDILYGHRASLANGNLFMAHRSGFTRSVLDGTLRAFGFATVATMRRGAAPFYDLWAVASKSQRSDEEMMVLVRDHFPQ